MSELILSYDMSTSEECTSAVFRGRCVLWRAYISEEECLKNMDLSIHFKKLEKEENSFKNSRGKGITRPDISEKIGFIWECWATPFFPCVSLSLSGYLWKVFMSMADSKNKGKPNQGSPFKSVFQSFLLSSHSITHNQARVRMESYKKLPDKNVYVKYVDETMYCETLMS